MITREATVMQAEAVMALERVQAILTSPEAREEAGILLSVLGGDPVLARVLALRDSLTQLSRHVQHHPSLLPGDFDICPETGALHLGSGALPPKEDDWGAKDEEEEEEKTDSCEPSSDADGVVHYSPELSGSSLLHCGGSVQTASYQEEFERAVERSAAGRQVFRVELARPPGTSLGFSVVGLRSPTRGELGIFVQEIQPTGIAHRDGRLEEGDQILAIDGQPLDSNISHQQAISILQQARGTVELVVARGAAPPSSTALPTSSSSAVEDSSTSAAPESTGMVLSTEWAEVESVELVNDGSGLGFGIIGGRSTGVVVKTILPGGVADRDGRLQSGDHILQIGDVNLRGLGSEQVASVLRQAGARVRLLVARPVDSPSIPGVLGAPLRLPTRILADPQELDRQMALHEAAASGSVTGARASPLLSETLSPLEKCVLEELPETETFEVELVKDQQGLGITIAGYVCEKGTDDEISGIFVKSVAKGSAADMSGRIRVNDQIIEVDGRPLQGYTNHQAVEVLRGTGKCVKLRLARYLRGVKYDQLQAAVALSASTSVAEVAVVPPAVPPPPVTPPPLPLEMMMMSPLTTVSAKPHNDVEETVDSSMVALDEKMVKNATPNAVTPEIGPSFFVPEADGGEEYAGELDPQEEADIMAVWSNIVGLEFEIVVAQLRKFEPRGGLGISLEGTVDVEDGREVRPHHYIRSVLPDGPVGLNGRLRPGDELLQVNGRQLLGLHHREVVGALKELPLHVRLVCARAPLPEPPSVPPLPSTLPPPSCYRSMDEEDYEEDYDESPEAESPSPPPPPERLVKAKSDGSLARPDWEEGTLVKLRSRSLEPLTGLAMWSSEPQVIELVKGDRGLGFSILDYQDPMNPSETVIVIRSLVPGGVAQQDGRLIPGDRLLFVNDVPLHNAGLDAAVQALKGAPRGLVRIGVAKPLPLPPDTSQVGEAVNSTQYSRSRPPLLKAESF